MLTIWHELAPKLSVCKHSIAFLQTALCELIFETNIGLDEQNIIELASLLKRHEHLLSDRERLYNFILMAKWYVSKANNTAATFCLNKAYELEKANRNSELKAIIQHVQAVNQIETGYAFRGYMNAVQALDYFKQTTKFYRLLAIHSKIASALAIFGMNEEATKLYNELITCSERFYPEFISIVQDELAQGAFMTGDYRNCLIYISQALANGSDNTKLLIYKSICLLNFQRLDELRALIEDELPKDHSGFLHNFLLFMQALVDENEESFLQLGQELLELAQQLMDLERERIILEMLLHFYRGKNDIVNENRILYQIIDNQKHRTSAI